MARSELSSSSEATGAPLRLIPKAVEGAASGPPSDADLVAYYTEHHGSLIALASLVAPEDGLAEDLVQEAFIRVRKARVNIVDRDRLGPYVRRTVVNLARGRARRLAVARRRVTEPPGHEPSAEDSSIRRAGQEQVVRALRTLAVRQRQCIVLRYYEGLTESEISDTLSISVGSVRTHISRGRANLADHLENLR